LVTALSASIAYWAAIVFVVALAASATATPLVSRLARALRVVDRPNERKVNRRADIPLLGGLAVAVGFAVGITTARLLAGNEVPFGNHLEGFFLGGLLMLAVGVVDDRVNLTAAPKFAVQGLAALVAITWGFRIDYVSDPFSRATFWFPEWMVWLVTVVWIVAITNALNLLDGLDGLAAGVGAIIASTLTIICWQAEVWSGVFLGVTFVGAVLGFLPFNFHPARIFLGDTGALFIGFSLSLLALEGYRKVSVLTFVVPLLALAVPLMDTGLSIVRRLRKRAHIFSADRLHIHHRLLDSEGSHRSAVLSIYFLTLCFCVIAVSFTRLQGYVAVLFLAAVLVLTLRLLRNLGFFEVEPGDGTELPPRPIGGEKR
jgi:UDP-GlcNAc:undecaprenyl-phosphate GlcNAc-1-phosphate transferase